MVEGYLSNHDRLGLLADELGISIGELMGIDGYSWKFEPIAKWIIITVTIMGRTELIHKTWDDLDSGHLKGCLLTVKEVMGAMVDYKKAYDRVNRGLSEQHKQVKGKLFEDINGKQGYYKFIGLKVL